jgi:hypothetical protein
VGPEPGVAFRSSPRRLSTRTPPHQAVMRRGRSLYMNSAIQVPPRVALRVFPILGGW